MAIRKELIDELIASSGGSLIGPDGLVKELTKALVERMLTGELNHHLGYEKHEVAGYGSGNSRNGKSQKTLKGEAGEITVEVPRDRNGTFEPKLIEKHQTRFEGFDSKILSMYALGMTVRDIQGHLQDMYGVEVSGALISEVTDSVLEEVKAWQDRPLEALYPIVYLDALMVKMRQDGKVENRAVYTAIGINMEGQKSVLGLWANGNEGAKYWMAVLMNLKNRGMKDAFVICTDGLKGFPEAIEAVFPSTLVQTCIVHLIRASLNFVNWKERKSVAADLKSIYRAATAERAEAALAEFRRKYPKHQGGRRRLGTKLAKGDPVLRFPGRDSKDHLHDQCGGVATYDAAQSDKKSRLVSHAGRRDQTAVSGATECIEKVAYCPRLARSAPPVCHPLA